MVLALTIMNLLFKKWLKKMNVKVKIDLTEVKAGMKKLDKNTQQAAEKAMKDTVVLIARDSIQGSPVLTGNNRRSIKYEVKRLAGSIFSTSGYGGYLETGTVKMPARPYFRPALDRNFPKFPQIMKRYLSW